MSGLGALARFARRAASNGHERCELCSQPLEPAHRHVVDLQRRTLCCSCRACALLFEHPSTDTGRYRTVPERVLVDPALTLDETAWSALGVPVRLACIFFNSSIQRWTALYPSPAGAAEAEPDADGWRALATRTGLIAELRPDVEALLVRGRRGTPTVDVLLAPIDSCYELIAQVRRHWRGFDGGDEVRQAVDAHFDRLRQRSRALRRGGTA